MSIVPVKDRLVIDIKKDLEWLFFSESIVSGSTDIEMFTPNTHLQSIQGMPTSLTSYSPPPTYRLGRQFEDAIALLFKHSKGEKLLQRNLVITGESRTLGELDCLYKNSNGSCVHLELAIKFYLYTGDKNSLDSFIGPGGKDRLDKKWKRLVEHQLPLSNTPAALQAIHHMGFASPKIRQLLLTGILFYPYHNWRSFICPNPLLNPLHLRGWWLFQNQIDNLQDEPDIRFVILPRWHWIGGTKHYDTLNPLTFELMKQQVHADNKPKMLACVRWDREAQCWHEASRGFIVRDNWPTPLQKERFAP
ncbi:DUF1853 family protein [Neptunomonas sp.]|uniref:DUF1853 family protein n=1 Tax=Neptunomonas sp. TaxID=1971898 RepID=UPI0025D8EE42|nr:DUF1853 family protein [Neptunomonas sp.]